jgi:predicted DNA-binding transcriptional regulator AlpA
MNLDDAATLIGRTEVAKRLGVCVRTLATLIKSGQFPKPIELGVGRLHRWRASTVLDWIDQRSRARKTPRPIVGRAAQLMAGTQTKEERVRERL